jgi:hypothetical protein
MLIKYEKVLSVFKKYYKVCLKLFGTIWNSILKQPMKLIQKISTHADAQRRSTKMCSYIVMAENK